MSRRTVTVVLGSVAALNGWLLLRDFIPCSIIGHRVGYHASSIDETYCCRSGCDARWHAGDLGDRKPEVYTTKTGWKLQ